MSNDMLYFSLWAIYLLLTVPIAYFVWRMTRRLWAIPRSLIRAAALGVLFAPSVANTGFFAVVVPAIISLPRLGDWNYHFGDEIGIPVLATFAVALLIVGALEVKHKYHNK